MTVDFISEQQHLEYELAQSRLIHLVPPGSWFSKYFFYRVKQKYIRYRGYLKIKEIEKERSEKLWARIQKRIVEGY